ncbi:DUF4184 family protein [Streptomyces sp. CB02959]|uniref:DUF4184 family protein n=1 Tax=Streptomyces sp. CB02959 TaxID=2020330 RepID=UPI0015E087F7|nr:DUF4184 family protein [Streptomyces sp. CB02959]
MPATFVHPAAVIPLFRGRLVPSALVIGSMVPDIYQLPFPNLGMHDWVPGLVFCPLQAALMLAVFHTLLKRPLVDLAGPRLRARLAGPTTGFRLRGPATFGWIWLSAVLGTATHLLFDDISHGRYFDWGLTPLVGSYSGTQLVQEGLSMLGLVVLVLAFRSWYRTAPQATNPDGLLPTLPRAARIAARAVLLGTVAAGVATEVAHPRIDIYRTFQPAQMPTGLDYFWTVTVDASLRGVTWGVTGILAYATLWQAWRLYGWLRSSGQRAAVRG